MTYDSAPSRLDKLTPRIDEIQKGIRKIQSYPIRKDLDTMFSAMRDIISELSKAEVVERRTPNSSKRHCNEIEARLVKRIESIEKRLLLAGIMS